ncbi:lipase/acyltransferase domain-containing protein [Leptospira idonii]|uniref:Lecithin--cholesterol acyltransferase n=1 Tax=Leptospira idonii TaxID=1193500 RepID=A0A4R9M222_9LEPT|nr:lecithin--cholesterol acyltransferase [Leptospira idonii]TGN19757.1 lecithin--cholesterol acyltransferase [Leptospira idonii]
MHRFQKRLFSVVCLPFFLIFFFGCSSSDLPHSIHSQPETIVVFVPGYKGSQLYQKRNSESSSPIKLWLNAAQGLNLITPDLSLKKEDGIYAEGALEKITLIPYLVEVPVYKPWIQFLASSAKIKFFVFSYDWRRDNTESVLKLESFLADLKKKYPNRLPVVVGHSNGGLITYSLFNSKPQLFSKIVLVGTPFRGGSGFLEDLVLGTKTGFNSKLTNSCVVSSFESVFSFFPRKESKWDTANVIKEEDGTPIQNDFFSAKDWSRLQLGPFSKESGCNIPTSGFQVQLDKAYAFRNSLDPKWKQGKYPPVLVVSANNRNTIRVVLGKKSVVENEKAVNNKVENWKWDIHHPMFAPGDGRVTWESANPPPGIVFESFLSEYEHSSLLNDPKVQEKILEFLETKSKE